MTTPDLFFDKIEDDGKRSLLPAVPVPRARPSHPSTSHVAARSVTGLTEKRALVLRVVRYFSDKGGLTLEALVDCYDGFFGTEFSPSLKQSPSGLRTRLHELSKMNPPLVVDTGVTRKTRSNRNAIVWAVAP